MVVVKERSVIVQFSLMGLLHLILPLLLQFCNTLKATWEKHKPEVRHLKVILRLVWSSLV